MVENIVASDIKEDYVVCSLGINLAKNAQNDPDRANHLAIAIRSVCEDYIGFVGSLLSPELVVDFDHVGNDQRYIYRYTIRMLVNQEEYMSYADIVRHVVATVIMTIEARRNNETFRTFDQTLYFTEKLDKFKCRSLNDKDLTILKNIEASFTRSVLSYIDRYGINIDLDILKNIQPVRVDHQINMPFNGENYGPGEPIGGDGEEGDNQIVGPGKLSGGNSHHNIKVNQTGNSKVKDNTIFLGRLDYLSLRRNAPCIWTVGNKTTKMYLSSEARAKIECNLDDYRGKNTKLTLYHDGPKDHPAVTFPGLRKKMF